MNYDHEKSVRRARIFMRAGVILRLAGNVAAALYWTLSYLDEYENILMVYNGGRRTIIVSAFFIIDTVLTILWLYKPKVFNVHVALFTLTGCIVNGYYLFDLFNVNGGGIGLLGFFFLALIAMIPQALPFALYNKGLEIMKNDER
ncbi:MAG: hypothetical protein IJ723_02645 [Ruminococcus sp.]|nr:hypothetical protein [Ruminococcus sp.]